MTKIKNVLLVIITSMFVLACHDDCPKIYGGDITDYGYKPDATTPNGYKIDTNGQEVSLEAIDCIIEAIETCFWAIELEGYDFEPVEPKCLKIVIADDWFHPVDNETDEIKEDVQIFPCDLEGAQGCAGVVQDGNKIIVPPTLAALSHELTHVHTQAFDPFPESFSPCADGIRADNCQEFIDDYQK